MEKTTTPIDIITGNIITLINSGKDDLALKGFELLEETTQGMGDIHNAVQEDLTRFRKMLGELDVDEKELGKIRKHARRIISNEIPEYLKIQKKLNDLNIKIIVNDEIQEKIIQGNMRSLDWVKKAMEKSRAICRVWVHKEPYGTGFIDKEGYLYTCHHVIPDKETAATSIAEFNFDDSSGQSDTVKYKLDATDFITSKDMDYTRVRLIDQPANSYKKWGYIELKQVEHLNDNTINLIHHPGKAHKHLSLLSKVVEKSDNSMFIKYTGDTIGGSSGAPVLNDQWQAIAIHQRGGDSSNKGTLLYYIMQDISTVKKNFMNLL